jgi:glycosyltransferase involved in cell wall biosynthesis
MRIAIVVPRYGDDEGGKPERQARWVAEHLAGRHRVEVLTTGAGGASGCDDGHEPGESRVGGLPVRRFPVARQRWADEAGPISPGLLRHLEASARDYDVLLFFSYRSWVTSHGLRVAPRRSLLVPAAEGDPSLALSILREVIRLPAALAFGSPEERDRLMGVSGRPDLRGEVVEVGVEASAPPTPEEIERRRDVLGEFIVYVGRIQGDTGCSRLFADFTRYVREQAPILNLVLVGKAVLPVPAHANVAHFGTVTEAEKRSLVGASRLLVHPSPRESPPFPLLEAWTLGRPVLVNGKCDVLRELVLRAGGGLYYSTYEEFAEALTWMRSRPRLAETIGRSGRAYVEAHHSPEVILEKYERLLKIAAAGAW